MGRQSKVLYGKNKDFVPTEAHVIEQVQWPEERFQESLCSWSQPSQPPSASCGILLGKPCEKGNFFILIFYFVKPFKYNKPTSHRALFLAT